MTTGLMGPLQECRDTVPRHDYPVLMPEVGLVPLPLLLLDQGGFQTLQKPVRTPVAILGSLGVCIYVPASRHWLISYSPIVLT